MKNAEHVQSRIENTIKRCFMLEKSGFNSTELTPQHKMHLYGVYGRPILLYGLESLQLTQQELQKLQRTEANIIKGCLRLRRRCRTKKLIYAMGVETMEDTLKRIKCHFTIRILNNPLTYMIINEIIRLKQGKNVHNRSHLHDMTIINGVESTSAQDLRNDSLIQLSYMDEERRNNEENEQLVEMRDILERYDFRGDVQKLGQILKAF